MGYPNPVTYEEALHHLHGLIGQKVMVSVWQGKGGEHNPLAILLGVLLRADVVDLQRDIPGMRVPPGETILFSVGSPEKTGGGGMFSFARSSYRLGRMEGPDLIFAIGRAEITVSRQADLS